VSVLQANNMGNIGATLCGYCHILRCNSYTMPHTLALKPSSTSLQTILAYPLEPPKNHFSL
jgi:hypothetical protein